MGGGTFGNVTPAAEFNIWADPEAADAVFRSGVPLRMCGLDLTHQVCADAGFIASIREIGSPLGDFVGALLAFYRQRIIELTGDDLAALHDPCAVLAVTQPRVVRLRPPSRSDRARRHAHPGHDRDRSTGFAGAGRGGVERRCAARPRPHSSGGDERVDLGRGRERRPGADRPARERTRRGRERQRVVERLSVGERPRERAVERVARAGGVDHVDRVAPAWVRRFVAGAVAAPRLRAPSVTMTAGARSRRWSIPPSRSHSCSFGVRIAPAGAARGGAGFTIDGRAARDCSGDGGLDRLDRDLQRAQHHVAGPDRADRGLARDRAIRAGRDRDRRSRPARRR